MQTINLYDAKNKFSRLVDAAEGGEIIIIARNGRAAAKLVPLSYGEQQRPWSDALQGHMREAVYDPQGFTIDRSDLLPPEERDLF
ncbi:type II toxin-antitoxin system Phd/YefM family antitoxin [Deinococcus marmoris]|uniref:Antitoxin n=1 Tax=Deinococcus marmoris TaxID=249408 RepID=A0A1U7NV04_9DEIO|nr:type II toxin-antitoxin system prevent-host-death family antitoxin [Deinococcus marmoris]OLV16737.1 YefM protein (antitoxin to YoeB) [Deinococcus marmoris]